MLKLMDNRLAVLFAICAALSGCQRSGSNDDTKLALQRQATSRFGLTANWDVKDDWWRKSLPKMRTSAFEFCIQRHPSSSKCFDEQDEALLFAAQADDYVASVRWPKGLTDKGTSRNFVLKHNPGQYRAARQYCFSVYRDSGSADARVLGPCIANALDQDYFHMGVLPNTPIP